MMVYLPGSITIMAILGFGETCSLAASTGNERRNKHNIGLCQLLLGLQISIISLQSLPYFLQFLKIYFQALHKFYISAYLVISIVQGSGFQPGTFALQYVLVVVVVCNPI